MTLFKVPKSFSTWLRFLFLGLPLGLVFFFLVQNRSLSAMELKNLPQVLVGVSAAIVFFYFTLKTGYFFVSNLFFGLGLVWCLFSTWKAFQQENFWLWIFSVAIALYFFGMWVWLRFEREKPALKKNTFWFQGVPRRIPEVSAKAEGVSEGMYLYSIDETGVYLFTGKKEAIKPSFRKSKIELVRGVSFATQISGSLVSWEPRFGGYGFEFSNLNATERQSLSRLIESLKGSGYV
jgi:hypothetical protein